MTRRSHFRVAGTGLLALLGVGIFSWPFGGPGAYETAETVARVLCEDPGPIEVLDQGRWAELARYTQHDRLRDPKAFGIEIRGFSKEPHSQVSGLWIVRGTGYNRDQPVVRLRNPVVHAHNAVSRAGLVGQGATFDCLFNKPSTPDPFCMGTRQ
jgi:hypothetical protein